MFSRCEENQGKSLLINTGKTVSELFAEKGYDFFECKTTEDIQNFKKYYQEGMVVIYEGIPQEVDVEMINELSCIIIDKENN